MPKRGRGAYGRPMQLRSRRTGEPKLPKEDLTSRDLPSLAAAAQRQLDRNKRLLAGLNAEECGPERSRARRRQDVAPGQGSCLGNPCGETG